MVTLDTLEPELVQIILEYVNNSSPRTTKSVALVNKYLYSATKIISNRFKTISYEKSDADYFQQRITRLFPDENALVGVQHLTIRMENRHSSVWGSHHGYEPPFEPIAKLVGQIGKLRTFTWSTSEPIPKCVLDALLTRQPAAKLKIFDFNRYDMETDHLTDVEAKIANSTALTHFRMHCNGLSMMKPSTDYRLAAFKRIVAQAPNLEYVGIIANNFEVETKPSEDNSEGLPILSPLQTKPNSSVRALTLDGPNLQLSSDTLNHWKDIVDLSQLTSLKFSRGIPTTDYFKIASQMLPNLKHVSLNFGAIQGDTESELVKTAQSYLYNCPPLHTISLWSWTLVVEVEELIRQHGATLESLQLHEKSNPFSNPCSTRKIMSLEDVKSIRQRCTRLSDLTMDLNRKDEEFDLSFEIDVKRYMTELSLFGSRLQKLQLYVDKFSRHGLPRRAPDLDDESESDEDDDDEEVDEDEAEDGDEEEDEEENSEADGDGDEANADASLTAPAVTAQVTEPILPNNVPVDGTRSDLPLAAGSATAIESTTFVVNEVNNASDSLFSPPPKRQRINERSPTPVKPSIETYVEDMWKAVYGDKTTGARSLDVKFGEWESRDRGTYGQSLFFEVRPHDRDDRQDQCWLKMQKKPGW